MPHPSTLVENPWGWSTSSSLLVVCLLLLLAFFFGLPFSILPETSNLSSCEPSDRSVDTLIGLEPELLVLFSTRPTCGVTFPLRHAGPSRKCSRGTQCQKFSGRPVFAYPWQLLEYEGKTVILLFVFRLVKRHLLRVSLCGSTLSHITRILCLVVSSVLRSSGHREQSIDTTVPNTMWVEHSTFAISSRCKRWDLFSMLQKAA